VVGKDGSLNYFFPEAGRKCVLQSDAVGQDQGQRKASASKRYLSRRDGLSRSHPLQKAGKRGAVAGSLIVTMLQLYPERNRRTRHQ